MNSKFINQLENILNSFKISDGNIKPHCIITGSSGTGKTYNVSKIAEYLKINIISINCAQLTKEGASGTSLSKVLRPLIDDDKKLSILFFDEFDKLYLSDNSGGAPNDMTIGVQNEFLKLLEGNETSVYFDYGKYKDVSLIKCLFIFSGAFNGEQNIDVNRLLQIGIKTEFLGRIATVLNTEEMTMEDLQSIVEVHKLMDEYISINPLESRQQVVKQIQEQIESIQNNPFGARLVEKLIHEYFITK